MKTIPLHDYVVVEKVERPTKSASGLFMPNLSEPEYYQARVMATGPGIRTEKGMLELSVKVNDLVLVPRQAGLSIRIDEKYLLAVREKDIICVLT